MSSNVKNFEIRKFGQRKAVKQHVGEASLTQQHLAEETDINYILAKYQKTGVITHVAKFAGQYGDFSGVPDYKTGLEMVMAADDMFMSLPSSIRDRFGNDPAQFIAFATDEKNHDEMIKMGLAPRPAEPPKPQLVQVVEPDETPVPPMVAKGVKIPAKGDQ